MKLNIFGYTLTIEMVKQVDDSPLHWRGKKAQEFQLRVGGNMPMKSAAPKIDAIKAVRKTSTELGYSLPSLADTKRYVEDVMGIVYPR